MVKFSFPIPGRKHHLNSSGEDNALPEKNSQRRLNKSKAHMILGAESNLNIDSCPAEQMQCSDSAMSVTISEPESATDSLSPPSERWDLESGVFPRGSAAYPNLVPICDDGTENASFGRRKLRNIDSASTLNSYHRRPEALLAVSQQTAASPSRNLALRKALPHIIPLRPLSISKLDQGTLSTVSATREQAERPHRRKPARLDLSALFSKPPRRNKVTDGETFVQTSNATVESKTSWRRTKLKKHQGGGRHRENHDLTEVRQKSDRGNTSPSAQQADTNRRYGPQTMNGHSERAVTMSEIHTWPLTPTSPRREPFSWANVRASLVADNSGASISSHNSTSSNHASADALASSDLTQHSILSLSSDSEGETVETEHVSHRDQKSRRPARAQEARTPRQDQRRHEHQSPLEHQTSKRSAKSQQSSRSRSFRKGAAQTTPCLTIPETSSPLLGIHKLPKREHQTSRKAPVASDHSDPTSLRPPPPLSPRSGSQETGSQTGRMMIVTKQEEALLEALRQKRARMREEIIEEFETQHSPPPTDRDTPLRSEPSDNTLRPRPKVKQLESIPIINTQVYDVSEPSPDLSDFLTFGSDDGSTPRTSWPSLPPNDLVKMDPMFAQRLPREGISPKTPPSAARLSAVGVSGLYRDFELDATKTKTSEVRFMEDGTHLNPHDDFILDDEESGVIWAM